ncbi:hypothetical protein LWI28_007500 [Acer negundo]|uniref:Uncharacterized protein n=1 Tax=Acer negundo TaxID=4023 RepID=A0AAD5JA42_ACENE|nr:hypothetical protein LWI28_007500 [Acer negundo]
MKENATPRVEENIVLCSGGGCGTGAVEEGSTAGGAGGVATTGSGTCYGSTAGWASGVAVAGFGMAGRAIGVTGLAEIWWYSNWFSSR